MPDIVRRLKAYVGRPELWLGILLGIALVLGLSYISREIAFYDEGIYVANAKALATGLGYRNVSLPEDPPQAKHPPFFPFLLSLIWLIDPTFPDNLLPMKVLTVLIGLGFLTVTYGYVQRQNLPGRFDAVVVVALIGLNTFFLASAALLTSDILYALLSVLALFFYEEGLARNQGRLLGLAIATAAVAFLTRTVGMVLLATLLLHLLLERRPRWAIASLMTGGGLTVAWLAWSQMAALSYAQYAPEVRANYIGYLSLLGSVEWMSNVGTILGVNGSRFVAAWSFFVVPWGGGLVGLLALAVAGYGWFKGLGPKPRAQDLYCAFYLPTILLVPFPDTARYFLPLSPFLIVYFLAGIRFLLSKGLTQPWPEARARRASRFALALVVVGTVGYDLAVGLGEYGQRKRERPVIYSQFHDMLGWIRDNTPSSAVLVGDYDPAYYLYTGRKAIRLSVNDNLRIYYAREVPRQFPRAGALLARFKQMRACHLVRDPMIGGPERLFFRNLIRALERASPTPFVPKYAGGKGHFVVYEITGCGDEVVSAGSPRES